MDINEVSELLGLCHFLRVPKHVFITDEVVSDARGTLYRGLQPKTKHDAIFLGQHADDTTPIHEAIHTLGIGELGAEVLTRAIMRKNRAISNFPLLKQQRTRQVSYTKVDRSKDYPEVHTDKFKGRVEHYVLSPFVQAGDF